MKIGDPALHPPAMSNAANVSAAKVDDVAADRSAIAAEHAPAWDAREGNVAKRGEPARPAQRPLLTLLIWLCMLSVVGGGGYAYYDRIYLPSLTPVAAPPKRPTPVLVAPVRQGNMSLYLNGLGTVTAFNSVTVRSRVDGELMRVAFTEGQLVQQGALLAQIDPRPYQVQLDQAKGPLARDQAALEVAKANLQRASQLAAMRAASQQEIDAQTALVKQAEAAIQADLALIANAQLQLDYCTITSPITGRIGLRLVDQGNMIRANDPNGLALVTQLQPISVVFTIPQDEIARVQQRMQTGASLQVEAYNRDFSIRLAQGTLSALDNQVDATTGTVRLKAKFDNENEMLFPNQFVNVRLLVDTRQDAILVPSAAIQRGPNFTFAYVMAKDAEAKPIVELRKITLGPTEGNEVAVVEGLAAGEMVVTDGLDKLQPGAPVTLRDASKKPATKSTSGAESKTSPAQSSQTATSKGEPKDAR